MSLTLVRAAAGCGKTTELARRYLGFVAGGIEVERAIAITFTRRAAAELVERVTLALRAALDGPIAEEARAALGPAWPLYEELVPSDSAVTRRALASLPSAPIGTTDRFVHSFLTEHALYAAVPVPGGAPVPIDVPILPTTALRRHLERAARRIIDPPGGGVDPDVRLLSRYFGLDEILGWLARADPYDTMPVARTAAVMEFVAERLAELLRDVDIGTTWQLSDIGNVDAVRTDLRARTRKPGRWAIDAVAPWLVGGLEAPPPFELAGWMTGLNVQSKARKALEGQLERTWLDLGPARLSLKQVVDTMRFPYDDRAHIELADCLQDARERLRKRVVSDGLVAAARSGELDHSSLTAAAIALCDSPAPRLKGRYAALLVDEVQDANPEQLALYKALAALPADPPIETVLVGDVRQSIYLFRGAEPAGFAELAEAASNDRSTDLNRNFRSHRALVAAHRALFGALEAPMRSAGYAPIDDLSSLEHDPSNDHLALEADGHDPPQPVWIVRPQEGESIPYSEADRRAVHAFWSRVKTAWSQPGHDQDTAVILTPSWRMARRACGWIRAWSGQDDSAFVDGGGSWMSGRVGSDLRMLLRALLDHTDEVAWLAVWKHPMVGLSDDALARIVAGEGLLVDTSSGARPAPDWVGQLGLALEADSLSDAHRPEDRAAWRRARGHLRTARDALGRDDLAGVFDRLFHALEWRAILLAGPGGVDDAAALEVALDLIRDLEAESASPDAVLSALQDLDAIELPRVQIDRPKQSISCTTIFQSKGLAWDHVAVLSPGRAVRPHDPSEPVTAWISLRGEPRRIVGLKFDPTGALSPFKDPVGRLGSRITSYRHEEECARLAYVAVTRARRSVTFGLPSSDSRCSPVQKLCITAWTRPELAGESVAFVEWPDPPERADIPTGWAAVAASPAERPPAPDARSWSIRQPSTYASHHSVVTRRQDAERFAHLIRLNRGLFVGGEAAAPPETLHTGIRAWEWGELAHGWLAHHGFTANATEELASNWLSAAWGVDSPAIARWLVGISTKLPRISGPLWERVTDPKAKLYFEHPFVGVAGRRDDVILSGRIDLLVQRGRRWTVIDFKAGGRSPTTYDDLIDQGGLRTYGPQLEAYRSALTTAGKQVESVGLWFVRTGTQVLW